MVGAESYRHPEKWAHLRKTHWRQHRAALPSALRQQGAAAAAAAAAAVACAPSPGASSTCATTPAGLVLRSSRVVSGGAAWCVRRSPKLGSRSSTNSRQQLAGSKAAAAVCLDGFLRCLRARAAPTRAADGHRLPDAKPTAEWHAVANSTCSPTVGRWVGRCQRRVHAGELIRIDLEGSQSTSSSRTNETAIRMCPCRHSCPFSGRW